MPFDFRGGPTYTQVEKRRKELYKKAAPALVTGVQALFDMYHAGDTTVLSKINSAVIDLAALCPAIWSDVSVKVFHLILLTQSGVNLPSTFTAEMAELLTQATLSHQTGLGTYEAQLDSPEIDLQ